MPESQLRTYGRRIGALSLAVAAIGFTASAPAAAATQVGETPTPDRPFCASGTATLVQSFSPAGQYVIPSAGVITSWSYLAASMPPSQLRLKIIRGNGGNSYTVLGESAVQTGLSLNSLNTFGTRITVHAGERLGLFAAFAGDCVGETAPAGYGTAIFSGGNQAVNSTATYMQQAMERLDVSAVLEPDADNDGFGDETQDACPGDASIQGDCAPPDTTITKAPEDKVKTKKKQANVTFEFGADEAATFECSLDGGPFAACTSPDTLTVKKGDHSFAVRAVDTAGNVDASPASDTWKVKRKKKK